MISQRKKRGAERKETLGSVGSKARSLCVVETKTGKRREQWQYCERRWVKNFHVVVFVDERQGKMEKRDCPGSIGHFALGGKREGDPSNTDQHRKKSK